MPFRPVEPRPGARHAALRSAAAAAQQHSARFPALDGFELHGGLFSPQEPAAVRALMVLSNATGVTAGFYRPFAAWLASQGVLVATFDYRYTGQSLPAVWAQRLARAPAVAGGPGPAAQEEIERVRDEALRSCPAHFNLTDTWARQDLAGAIDWVWREARTRLGAEKTAELELTLLGHSLGAHLGVVLAPEFVLSPPFPADRTRTLDHHHQQDNPKQQRRVERILGVGQANPHWRLHASAGPQTVKMYWQEVVAPILIEEEIFRSSAMGLGVDYPLGPGWEWYEWFMHPLFSLCRPQNERNAMTNLQHIPLTILHFAGDEIIREDQMYETMAKQYATNGRAVRLVKIDPDQTPDLPYGGHVHLFRAGTGGQNPDTALPRTGPILPREQVYWPTVLAYVALGQLDTEILSSHEEVTHHEDFAGVRRAEQATREEEHKAARLQGLPDPIFDLEDALPALRLRAPLTGTSTEKQNRADGTDRPPFQEQGDVSSGASLPSTEASQAPPKPRL